VTAGLPVELFENEELNTLDLSHNNLTEVPEGICRAKSLLVLNLSHNNLEIVSSQLLMSCTDLLHLDLSNNSLEQLPPQLRRLTNLQTLALSNNPLSHFQVFNILQMFLLYRKLKGAFLSKGIKLLIPSLNRYWL
jgi:Leucine-rich repeat (LRR) protein